ncbi:3-hydroxyacyl-CoA dehydrogenase/enoyl-CoA hydratase family protein [Desulfobacula sp.]|uniref:3-hydroxyacyl-CoA dehydrogenase/enoyl-CoA hydratase family protein n=1 Tax=Desulfobacula sp. TaxID=2593537 RepID=UPI00261F1DC4|nr:3-hydroxyacyl-CoA dehydrogenase/enoyl-CoA hydratase family protein [Desulfobacula sp.]
MTQMNKIGIVGAGNMGSGIVQKTAMEGLQVVMLDIKEDFVQRGLETIRTTFAEAVERKILRPEQVEDIMGRIQGTTNMEDVKDCDLVIEAVFEDMNVKKELFANLDKICDEKTILATNTSSFSVEEMAKATHRPDRFVGLHFFYHPAKNRLLEIIPGPQTSNDTIKAAQKYSKLTGKTDITVKDSPGFAVNRFFTPLNNEAFRVLEEGIANTVTIDEAFKKMLNVGMGPFLLVNVTGVPIALHAQVTLHQELGEFFKPAEILKKQIDLKEDWPLDGEVDESKFEQVTDRLLGSVFYDAVSLLQDGVTDILDTDVGAKVGLRWRKGPFEMMNELGIDKSYAMVEKVLAPYPNLDVPQVLKDQKAKGEPWDIRYVKYTRDGAIGRVRISRPDALNALNHAVVKQLDEAFAQAEADTQTTAIVLEAAGKAFVAGADIKFFVDCIKGDKLDDNYAFTAYGQEVLNRIDDSKKLVVAKMEGLALGGGLELAMSTDVMVATPKVVMSFPETGIGITPGLGGTQRTSRFVGKELGKYLVFTGRTISAVDANAIGLVDYVFNPDEIDEKIVEMITAGTLKPQKGCADNELPAEWKQIKALFADENIDGLLKGKYAGSSDKVEAKIAKILAAKAPLALTLSNQIMDKGYAMSLKDGLKEELAHLYEIFSTEDALLGLTNIGKKVQYAGK